MIYALAILILAASVCYLLSFAQARGDIAARFIAPLGAVIAFAVALYEEGLQGGGIAGVAVAWPDFLGWLGAPSYTSDTLSASLGAWCILLGGLCLLRLGDDEEGAARKLSAATLVIAVLYSLVYTTDLRAFAAQVLLLVLLAWAILWQEGEPASLVTRRSATQIGGALALLTAVLVMGRTTGGIYGLRDISLSSLTFWPLLLTLLFAILWLGLAPIAGWSALVLDTSGRTTQGALLQGLVLGVPALVLILRLEALITDQALAGSVPAGWTTFTSALAWLGIITILSAAAGTVVWAGTARWSASLTAFALGSATWALGLDTPAGRYAAIAILLAFGLARLTLDLSAGRYDWLSRLAAGISLVGAPLTAGFVGLWLLASALVEARHASLAIVLAGAAILAACGSTIHLAITHNPASTSRYADGYLGPLALILSLLLMAGGMLPGLWLPQVQDVASIAGSGPSLTIDWTGLAAGNMVEPFTLLAGSALLLAAIGMILRLVARSRTTGSSVLLPTAVARLQKIQQQSSPTTPLISNPPPLVWWLSLVWLENGMFGSGALLNRLSARFGILLARLEGRYYFPLALILTLLILLAITR